MVATCGLGDTVRRRRVARVAGLGLAALALLGCESLPQGEVDTVYQDEEERRRARAGGGTGSVLDAFGIGQIGNVQIGSERQAALTGTDVNKHLWRASLDTLAFLPIVSTDPFTGLIATDWGAAPQAPEERFRVTAYVTDTTLAPESLRVAVFREVRADGAWAPAPVAEGVARQIEDAILVRARQLRLAERGVG